MTTPTAWPGYQPPTFVGYPSPVADPAESRTGQALDQQFFTDLVRTVAGALPRLTRVGMVTPADGQVAQVDASSGNVTMPALPALPNGAVVGYERADTATTNTVTITSGAHTLRFRGHMVLLISRGAGVWDRLANWLPYDPMKTLFDGLYATKTELSQATQGGGSGGSGGSTSSSTKPRAYHNFRDKSAGALLGTPADSGQTWKGWNGGAGSADMVVANGKAGFPAGFTAGGSANPGSAANYACLEPGGTVGRTGAFVVWDQADAVTSAATLGAFTQLNVSATAGGANAHLGIYPWGVIFGVFAAGANELTASGYLVPDGYDMVGVSPPGVRFPTPLVCDGVTEHRIEVQIDKRRARAYVLVNDLPVLTYTDPRIASVEATFAFWECYSVTGGTNLPRFTEVWADTVAAMDAMPQSAVLAAAQAGAGPGKGGSGPASQRPSSRMRNGATWWDRGVSTTMSAQSAVGATPATITVPVPVPVGSIVVIDTSTKAESRLVTARSGTGPYVLTLGPPPGGAQTALLASHVAGTAVLAGPRETISDGAYWRDASSGIIVGNRLAQNTAIGSEDATGLVGAVNASATMVRAPSSAWRTPRVYKVTCTVAGTVTLFPLSALAEVGNPFFAGVRQIAASRAISGATLALSFYDPANNASAGVTTPATAIPALASGPVDLLSPSAAVTPAGCTTALPVLSIPGCVVGDVIYLTDISVGFGPVPAHLLT